MIKLPNGLFEFQEQCSLFLVDTAAKIGSRQTIILLNFIDNMLNELSLMKGAKHG